MNMFRIFHRTLLTAALGIAAVPAHAAPEKVVVRLNFVPGVEHAFLYLGKEKGWYADAGIDLEVLPGQGSTVAVKNVGSGEDQFAIADTASVARGWEVGVPIVFVAMLLKESPTVIYSLKAKGIETMADLCGKRVGVNIKSTAAEQYQAMLRLANLKSCEIDQVPLQSGGAKEVLSGAVDAAVNFSYTDALLVKTQSGGVNMILARDSFKLLSLGVIANRTYRDRNPKLVDRFVRVTLRSLRYTLAHKDEALATFVRVSPSANLPYESAKFDFFAQLLTTDDPGGGALGKQTRAEWEATLKVLHDIGIVKMPLSADGRFVPLPSP